MSHTTGINIDLMMDYYELTGDPHGERQYRDPEFDKIWATAVELDSRTMAVRTREAAIGAGVREVHLIEQPMAAAVVVALAASALVALTVMPALALIIDASGQ